MRRKILMGVAALALPLGTLVGLQTSATAGSPLPPDPPLNCTAGGPVTFAAPGLSSSGSATTAPKSTTTATVNFGGGCSGSLTVNISSKNTKCKGAGNPTAACTGAKGQKEYDSESGFAMTGTSAIAKSLKKLTFTINGITYQTKTTSANAISCSDTSNPPGGNPTETGFQVNGLVKKPKQDKGQTTQVNACLGADSGPGTSGNFTIDLGTGNGTIATATIDPITSTVTSS